MGPLKESLVLFVLFMQRESGQLEFWCICSPLKLLWDPTCSPFLRDEVCLDSFSSSSPFAPCLAPCEGTLSCIAPGRLAFFFLVQPRLQSVSFGVPAHHGLGINSLPFAGLGL